jgi:Smg protein
MTENFLQILLYLFRCHDIQSVLQQDDNATLLTALRQLGFDSQDVRTAIAWLGGFKQIEHAVKNIATPAQTSIRVFTENERQKLAIEVRGFIHLMQQNGLLDHSKCELIIERAMSLEGSRICMRDLHCIINVILTNNAPQDTATRNAYLVLLSPNKNPH